MAPANLYNAAEIDTSDMKQVDFQNNIRMKQHRIHLHKLTKSNNFDHVLNRTPYLLTYISTSKLKS